MRSHSVQYRVTQIPAHLKNKQNYGISRAKALHNWYYHKPSDKHNIISDEKLIEIKIRNDELKGLLKEIDAENKKQLMIEEIQKQDKVDVITINLKDKNSIQNLAIKLINASLLEVEKLEKIILFIG